MGATANVLQRRNQGAGSPMTSQAGDIGELEVVHVLFVDIVGYSLLPVAAQRAEFQTLRDIARCCSAYEKADEAGELISLPTGDGFALAFLRDPAAPVRCALEVARSLRERGGPGVRMGVHSGPVVRVEDIRGAANIAGSGINFAQRVMNCGDENHILLSGTVVDLLQQVASWPGQDLGECEVKHGYRVRLFNLFDGAVGNPAVPARVSQTVFEDVPSGVLAARRVALLYKRHASPDERLVALLEHALRERGLEAFVDRHMVAGVQWAQEIERQLRTADAVISLISATALASEMLAYELQIAHDSAQQYGRPRLIPVRIAYEGPLPEQLARILDPIEYALWQGPEDDEALVRQVIRALEEPGGPAHLERTGRRSTPVLPLEAIGGAVSLASGFYVEREADRHLTDAVSRRDSIILVKGGRQIGKTSLLARGLRHAREAGCRVVLSDFQKLNAADLESPESLYLTLAEWLADQLDLDAWPDEAWQARRGPNINFERFLRRYVLTEASPHLVWGLDEVDRLFSQAYCSEVFGLFRSWHNERSLDPDGPWSRLTLAIAYATEAHLFITDVNQSPFNVGTRIPLEDFSLEQIGRLNELHGSPLSTGMELVAFHELVGGQPYLVRRGLYHLVDSGQSLAEFGEAATAEDGPYGDHLRRFLVLLARDQTLTDQVRASLAGQALSAEGFHRLRSAGLYCGDSPKSARPRCDLYAAYLQRHLL